jgi:hypothetical protein
MSDTIAVTQSLRNSFMTSYLILMGYTGLTAIEALRTPSVEIRHVMNIETTVSLVAAIVYSIFNEMLKAPTIDLSQITQMRYIDWSITIEIESNIQMMLNNLSIGEYLTNQNNNN